MNDLIRPTLYDAWHSVEAVNPRQPDADTPTYDIVGPICESGDSPPRTPSLALHQGDLLPIMSAGAYAFTMARQSYPPPRAAAIITDSDQSHDFSPREQHDTQTHPTNTQIEQTTKKP